MDGRRLNPHLLGIDLGTESVRAGVFAADGTPLGGAATPYRLSHPRPGWAEQDPDEWWSSLIASVRGAIAEAQVAPETIAGISYDCTSCTVVALDRRDRPLRPAILWMDVRAADQARRIGRTEHPARALGGRGPVSAEWYPSKALWLKEQEPGIYGQAAHLVDATDWLTHRLTGRWTSSINTASARAYYDEDAGGWPGDFYEEIGLGDVLEKVSGDVLPLGAPVGGLTPAAASDLGLCEGTRVAQGAGDAWAAQIGLDAIGPGRLAVIAGSSHVVTGQSDHALHGAGFFGTYAHAVVPGEYTIEGGQVSTGSIMRWFRDQFCSDLVREAARCGRSAYELLNEESRGIPPGSEGLVCLDYWQGNRTPYVDPQARGIIWGLTLHHTRAHVYHALQEGICYGTAHALRAMRAGGFEIGEFVAACGGVTRSRDWMQMHADVIGQPIRVTEAKDAAVLGAAALGAVGAGLYPSVHAAAGAMVCEEEVIEPDLERHRAYAPYVEAYVETYPRLRDLIHGIAAPPPA
ncbi:MAG: FGGY family carbohydrate kinase [Candidatus Dormiibacterota bacterium]